MLLVLTISRLRRAKQTLGQHCLFALHLSLHGVLGTSTCEDLIGNCHFLHTTPVVLVTPNVAPSHEEGHGNHGDEESAHEGLSAHNWHKEVGQQTCGQSVLKTTQLILWDPMLAIFQVNLSAGRDACIVDQEVNELKRDKLVTAKKSNRMGLPHAFLSK